jgi:hypothetical protein
MADPDMFEHAHRDDAVERTLYLAVVLQEEADTVAEAVLGRPAVGNRMLLFRERHPDYVDTGAFGQIETEASPAGADVEHTLARLKRKLGGKVPLLRKLGVVEIGDAIFEIGAGILQIVVEEERV